MANHPIWQIGDIIVRDDGLRAEVLGYKNIGNVDGYWIRDYYGSEFLLMYTWAKSFMSEAEYDKKQRRGKRGGK